MSPTLKNFWECFLEARGRKVLRRRRFQAAARRWLVGDGGWSCYSLIVGLYSGHMYADGQIGSGTSKYVHYLIRDLEARGVEVVRLRKGENPRDVDVLHDPHAPWNAPLLPRRPLIITIQDLSPRTFPQYYSRWVRTLFLNKTRYLARRAARILVPSHRTAAVVTEAFRPKIPIDVVYYGVEDHFRPGVSSTPSGPPYLVQVGVHRKIKVPMVTVQAFEEIAGAVPHDLRLVGTDNVLLQPVKAYLQSRPNIAERVKFEWPGEAAIPSIYNRTDLVVHPCPEEGFGFVPLEALACGAHILARAPAVREILGPYGCYFDDPGQLPDAILRCLQDGPKGTLAERVAHARRFSFRQMGGETEASYEAAAELG